MSSVTCGPADRRSAQLLERFAETAHQAERDGSWPEQEIAPPGRRYPATTLGLPATGRSKIGFRRWQRRPNPNS
jgi:hypothetical protein